MHSGFWPFRKNFLHVSFICHGFIYRMWHSPSWKDSWAVAPNPRRQENYNGPFHLTFPSLGFFMWKMRREQLMLRTGLMAASTHLCDDWSCWNAEALPCWMPHGPWTLLLLLDTPAPLRETSWDPPQSGCVWIIREFGKKQETSPKEGSWRGIK